MTGTEATEMGTGLTEATGVIEATGEIEEIEGATDTEIEIGEIEEIEGATGTEIEIGAVGTEKDREAGVEGILRGRIETKGILVEIRIEQREQTEGMGQRRGVKKREQQNTSWFEEFAFSLPDSTTKSCHRAASFVVLGECLARRGFVRRVPALAPRF